MGLKIDLNLYYLFKQWKILVDSIAHPEKHPGSRRHKTYNRKEIIRAHKVFLPTFWIGGFLASDIAIVSSLMTINCWSLELKRFREAIDTKVPSFPILSPQAWVWLVWESREQRRWTCPLANVYSLLFPISSTMLRQVPKHNQPDVSDDEWLWFHLREPTRCLNTGFTLPLESFAEEGITCKPT